MRKKERDRKTRKNGTIIATTTHSMRNSFSRDPMNLPCQRRALGNILRTRTSTSTKDDGDGAVKKKRRKKDLRRGRRKHFEGTTVREFLSSDATTKAFPTALFDSRSSSGNTYIIADIIRRTSGRPTRQPLSRSRPNR